MTRRLVPIADGAVDLIETGAGEHTIILVHGTASSPRAMGKLAALLAGAGWRVLTPVMIGYGASMMAGNDGVIARNARLLLGLRASVGKARVVIVGHSMGGLVVLQALRMGMAADAVALYEPVAFGVLDQSDPTQRAARAWDAAVVADMSARIARGDTEAGVGIFIEAWNGQAWADMPPPVRAALVAIGQVLVDDVTAISAEVAGAASYAAIAAPTLLIFGDRSPDVAPMVCQGLAGAIPGATIARLANAGHMAPVQQPDLVAAAVLRFLGGLAVGKSEC